MTALNVCICCISLRVMTHAVGPAESCIKSAFYFKAKVGKPGETSKSEPDFWRTTSLCLCPVHGWWVLLIRSFIKYWFIDSRWCKKNFNRLKKTLLVCCTALMSCRLSGGVTALLPNMFASCFLHGYNGIKLVDSHFTLSPPFTANKC